MKESVGEQMKRVKEDPSELQRILYPGKQLSEFDAAKLPMTIVPSGFPSLDTYQLLKKGRGELIILGARPSLGKSALGFQLALNVAKSGKAHVFSLEMDYESIVVRQLAAITNKPSSYIQSGKMPSEEIEQARAVLDNHNCVIDDEAGLTVYQICDRARMEHKRGKTDVIVVDYIQIIRDEDQGKRSRAVTLGEISSELKNLAKELRVPVIVLSQLNRNSESREDGRPELADIKESGQIEQDADVALLLHRQPDSTKVIIAKHRNGKIGEVSMRFAAAQCRFIDEEQEYDFG